MNFGEGIDTNWYLDRAYLNLYELSDRRFMDSLKEFICLHSLQNFITEHFDSCF